MTETEFREKFLEAAATTETEKNFRVLGDTLAELVYDSVLPIIKQLATDAAWAHAVNLLATLEVEEPYLVAIQGETLDHIWSIYPPRGNTVEFAYVEPQAQRANRIANASPKYLERTKGLYES